MSTENNNQEHQELDPVTRAFYESIAEENVDQPGESSEESPEKDNTTPDAADEGEEKPADDTNKQPESSEDQPSFDLVKYFEESSEGLIKSEDDFKASIQKIKDFDTLQQKLQVLESEKETIFANDEIKKLNELHKKGLSQEQIDTFMSLSKLDVGNLSAKEILVQNEILNNGHTKAVAERIVQKRYDLSQYEPHELDTDEERQTKEIDKQVLESQMEKEAKSIREQFSKEIEDLQKPISPEQKALDEAAKRKSYEQALQPFAEVLSTQFPKEIALEIEGEKVSYPVPQEVIDSIQTDAVEYFNQPNLEVNKENVDAFIKLKKAEFIYDNLHTIAKNLVEQGRSIGAKAARAEFENPNDPNKTPTEVDTSNIDNIDEQLRAIVRQS